MLLDVLHSSPARETTGETAEVTALRGLTQVRLLLGGVRPYLIAGAGGLLFNFGDTNDTAVGALTAGGGVELRIRTRALLYAEGSADIYRARRSSYSSTGSVLYSSDRRTETAVAALAGISVEF